MTADDLTSRQVHKWNAVADAWAQWWPVFERAAQPVSDRLVDLGRIGAGHRVLDIATGIGEPALTAAQRVGPSGRVVATDCAPDMLRQAARRAEAMALTNLDFLEMDGERPDFAAASFDAVLCRWGLMFVPDLTAAFEHYATLLRPGGRFAAAVWGQPEEVPLIHLPGSVLAEHVPVPDSAAAPFGPFRLSEDGLMQDLMAGAGFRDIAREEVQATFTFASAQECTRFRRDVSSADDLLAEHHPADAVEAAWQAVTEATGDYADESGTVRLVNTVVCYSGTR